MSNSELDKLRTLNHFFLQEINADVLNGIGDEQFRSMNYFSTAFIAGFTELKSLIFQDLELSLDSGFTLNTGTKGVFLLRKSESEGIVGVYRGIRASKAHPYQSDTLTFSSPDATNDRIDIIEADIVEEEDSDYSQSVTFFNQTTEQTFPDTRNTKRVQEVKLFVKEGAPAASPVAPTATSGRMVLAEVIIRSGSAAIAPADILQLDIDPALNPWSLGHDTRMFPAIFETFRLVEEAMNHVIIGGSPGWDYVPVIGSGTIEEPDAYLYSKGSLRLRLSVTWGTTGGEDGNPIQVAYEFSDDNGGTYSPIGTSNAPNGVQSISYDASGNVTSSTWS